MAESIIITGSKFNSIVTFIGVILIAGLIVVGYFGWKSLSDENTKLRNEVVSFKQLTSTLVRSSNKWATEDDLKQQLKNLLDKEDLYAFHKDMETLDSRLSAVGRTIGSINYKVATLEPSDKEGVENPKPIVCDNGKLVDIHSYTKKSQMKELKDSNKASIAEVEFNAAKEKPWSYKIYKRNYRMVTVVGKKDSGQLTFHHKLEYFIPDKDPKKYYKVELLSSDYMQIPLRSRMFWLNPRLDFNIFAGGRVYGFAQGPGRSDNLVSLGADVGLSLSSYGETKVDSLFRLFRFGIGYNAERQAAHFSFAPFALNIGKPLPLLTNLYIAPQVGIDTAGGLTINVGTGLQF
jgi:hypothetical protein